MKKTYFEVKLSLEIERLAKEEAEKIVAEELFKASELLRAHFERVTEMFAHQISEAVMEKYRIIKIKHKKSSSFIS